MRKMYYEVVLLVDASTTLFPTFQEMWENNERNKMLAYSEMLVEDSEDEILYTHTQKTPEMADEIVAQDRDFVLVYNNDYQSFELNKKMTETQVAEEDERLGYYLHALTY